MKINQILQGTFFKSSPIGNNNNKNEKLNTQNQLERTPQKDCVNFTGRPPVDLNQIVNNANTENGLTFARNLIEKIFGDGKCSLQVVSGVLHKQYPNVELKPMSELSKIIPNASDSYKAYSSSELNKSFEKVDFKMYIGLPKSMQEIPEFISDASHECTHISQDVTDKTDADILKSMSKGNRRVAESLSAISESTFSTFDLNAMTYKQVVKDKEGNKIIDSHLRNIVSQCLKQMSNEPDQTHINDVMSVYSDPNKLVSDVKRYCACKAGKEKEAYATEYILAKAMERPEANVYGQVVEFYSNLQDAFRER